MMLMTAVTLVIIEVKVEQHHLHLICKMDAFVVGIISFL